MTAETPQFDTIPKTIMTDLQRYHLTLTVEQHVDDTGRTHFTASEPGVDLEGRGPSGPAAIAAYARRVSVEHGDGHLAPERRPNAQVVAPEEVSEE
jgi:hypothetical protein